MTFRSFPRKYYCTHKSNKSKNKQGTRTLEGTRNSDKCWKCQNELKQLHWINQQFKDGVAIEEIGLHVHK